MPKFDLDKIKFATDGPTFEKAIGLYENGKVTQLREGIGDYTAVVLGTKPYRVSIEARRYGLGNCDCYLGQKGYLCKHMVAVAIHAVQQGRPLAADDTQLQTSPVCSGKRGILSKTELSTTKKDLTVAMRYIKPYNGPSRLWFSYQGSLAEGCARLAALVSNFPVSEQTARLLVDTLLRLDNRLCRGGVDDSDGTVGGFMEEMVAMLRAYAELDPECTKAFGVLKDKDTCFGWEKPLVELVS